MMTERNGAFPVNSLEKEINASATNLFGDISTYYVASWPLNRFVDVIQEAG